MDLDRVLISVQGTLLCTERTIGASLVTISRECEREACMVVTALSRLALEEPSLTPDDFRRINLFLLLNSDFPFVQKIKSRSNQYKQLVHLLGKAPTISTYLYCKILTSYDWSDFLGEIIVQCPEIISFELLSSLLTHTKLIPFQFFPNFMDNLFVSIFIKILVLHGVDSDFKKTKFTKLFQKLAEICPIEFFNSKDLSLEIKQQFSGENIKMLIESIGSLVIKYKMHGENPVVEGLELYNVLSEFSYSYPKCIESQQQSWAPFCLSLLVTKCKKLLQGVSVDTYMSWSEVDELHGGGGRTLQRAVREAAWSCRQTLLDAVPLIEDHVLDLKQFLSALEPMVLKPAVEADEIAEATFTSLVRNLQNPNRTQWMWFDGVLDHPDFDLSDSSHTNIIRSFSHFLNCQSALILIEKVIKKIQSSHFDDTCRKDELKYLVFDCIKGLPSTVQINVLHKFFEDYGPSEVLMTRNFTNQMTEVFNKLVEEQDGVKKMVSELVVLSLQSRSRLINQLITNSIKNYHQVDAYVEAARTLEPPKKLPSSVKNLFTEAIIGFFDTVIKCPQDYSHFIILVQKLAECDIIHSNQILIGHVIPLLEKALAAKDWKSIEFFLNLHKAFLGSYKGKTEGKRAVVLAFLAQTMEKCRAGPSRFTESSSAALSTCISVVRPFVEHHLAGTASQDDKEVEWLRQLVGSLSPFTRFHFKELWTKWNLPLPAGDDRALFWTKPSLGVSLHDLDKTKRTVLVAELCKVLPLLCYTEWMTSLGDQMADKPHPLTRLAVFHIVADSLLVLCKVRTMISNKDCLKYCFLNFSAFFQAKIASSMEHVTKDDKILVLEKVVLLLKEYPEDCVDVSVQGVLIQAVAKEVGGQDINQAFSKLLSILEQLPDPALRTRAYESLGIVTD